MNDRDSDGQDGPFDMSIFDNLRYLSGVENRQIANEVMALFETQLVKSLDTMRVARETSDLKSLSAESHALKGAGGNVGAKRLARFCEELGAAARSASLESIDACLVKIEAEARLIKDALTAAMARP
jgi:HPt (histidine-containing phosphotransfer) domain-containing protein